MTITIALEGPDRVGKKTQAFLLKEELETQGVKVISLEIPWSGNKKTYDMIYRMLENGSAKRHPTLFQVVQNVNKYLCQVMNDRIFRESDYVILDRWRLSSMIYGTVTRANKPIVKALFSLLFQPDVTIILVGEKLVKTSDDDYERDDVLQHHVKMLYEHISGFWEKKSTVINVDKKSREDVHKEVMSILRDQSIVE